MHDGTGVAEAMTWRRLLGLCTRRDLLSRGAVSLYLLLGLADLAAGIAIPLRGARIVNALVTGSAEQFWRELTVLGALTLLRPCLNVGLAFVALGINEHLAAGLRRRVAGSIFGRPFSAVEALPVGDLLARTLNDTNVLKAAVTAVFSQMCVDALTLAVVVVVLIRMNVALALALTVSLPLTLLYRRTASARVQEANRQQREGVSTATAVLHGWVSRLSDVKLHHVEGHANRDCDAASQHLRRTSLGASRVSTLVEGVNVLFVSIPSLLVFGFGGVLTLRHELLVGDLFAFIALTAYFYVPAQRLLATALSSLPALYPAATRVMDVIADWEPGHGAPGAPIAARAVVVDRLAYTARSASGPFFLSVPSLSVAAGEIVALVGQNGSGKSTLASLIGGVRAPAAGAIMFATADGASAPLDNRASPVHVVPQKPAYFRGTLVENIALFEHGPDRLRADAVVREVGLNPFVSMLPAGLDTNVLDTAHAARMSGGELQRLGLARALYSRASVLVLDEPFANMDTQAALDLLDVLRRRYADRAVLLITHDVRVVSECDRVYRLAPAGADHGSVCEAQPRAVPVALATVRA